MPERLLYAYQVADRLGISARQFCRLRFRLRAKGLQAVRVGEATKYRESSLDGLIARAAEAEGVLA